MNLNKNTTTMTESAVMAGVMALLFILGLSYLPILIVFFPVPFVIVGIKQNLASSWASLIVASFISLSVIDIVSVITIAILVGIIGSSLILLEKRNYSTSVMIGFTSIITIVSIAGMIALVKVITGISFVDYFKDLFEISKQYFENNMSISEIEKISNMNIEDFRSNFNLGIKRSMMLLPTTIILLTLVMTYLSYWGSVVILRKMNINKRPVPKFELFRLPEHILIGVGVIGFGSLIVKSLEIIHYEALILNLITLASFVFGLQGYAVALFKLNRSKISKVFRIVILVVLIINSYLLTVFGLIDTIFDFRKIKKVENGD